MLFDKLRSSLRITARAPRAGLDQYLHMTCGGHAKQPESKESAEPARAWVLFSTTAAFRRSDCQPNLVGSYRAINTLQHKVQIEAEFQLSNHNDRRIVATKSDKVTAADFTLHLKSEGLEEPFYGQIKRSLQDTSSRGAGSLSQSLESLYLPLPSANRMVRSMKAGVVSTVGLNDERPSGQNVTLGAHV